MRVVLAAHLQLQLARCHEIDGYAGQHRTTPLFNSISSVPDEYDRTTPAQLTHGLTSAHDYWHISLGNSDPAGVALRLVRLCSERRRTTHRPGIIRRPAWLGCQRQHHLEPSHDWRVPGCTVRADVSRADGTRPSSPRRSMGDDRRWRANDPAHPFHPWILDSRSLELSRLRQHIPSALHLVARIGPKPQCQQVSHQ